MAREVPKNGQGERGNLSILFNEIRQVLVFLSPGNPNSFLFSLMRFDIKYYCEDDEAVCIVAFYSL